MDGLVLMIYRVSPTPLPPPTDTEIDWEAYMDEVGGFMKVSWRWRGGKPAKFCFDFIF
jgi:hypothetical protein